VDVWGDDSTATTDGRAILFASLRSGQRIALLRLLLLFLSLTLLSPVAACGGNDARPKEQVKSALTDYFDKYLAIHRDVNGRIVALKTRYPKGYLDLTDKSSADLQQTRDSYRDYATLFDEFDSRVRALDPPAEISDLVQQVLEADQAVSAINHARLAQLEGASSTADLDMIFAQDPGFTAAVNRTVEVCTSMIERAKQYEYELDLPCRG
jgi:hypothetical protein